MSGTASAVSAAVARLAALASQPVPDDLRAWADLSHVPTGFPLLGTHRCAESYVALQWNGERAARAGLGMPDLVVLTGLVAAWQHDRTVGDLQTAVGRALSARTDVVAEQLTMGAPVTADVVTTAVCAGVLSGVPEDELIALVDLAGTLLQVRPRGAELSTVGDAAGAVGGARPATGATAAGHTAAAGWLAVQVHLAGLVAYPGAFTDTVATATFPSPDLRTDTAVRELVAGLA